MPKYVLYEESNGDMLFTKEENVNKNPNLLEPFTNKKPTFSIESDNDGDAIIKMNEFIALRALKKD